MRTFLRSAGVVLVAMLVAMSVFAGGQSEQNAASSSSQKTTISYWFFPQIINVPGYEGDSKNYGDWEKFVAAAFMKEHPNITVNTQLLPWEGGPDKINVAIAGGNPPEVVFDYLGRTGAWFEQGAAQPLGGVVPASLENDILPSFKSLYTLKGQLSGIPLMAWSIVLMVNQHLTDQYNVTQDLPKPGQPWTHEQFVSALKAMKDSGASKDGVFPYIMGAGSEQGDYLWWEMLWGFGAHLYDSNGNIVSSSPEMVAGYKWLLSLEKQGLMAPGSATMTGSDTMKVWSSQKTFLHGGNGFYRTLLEKGVQDGTIQGPVKVFALPYPTNPGVKPQSALGPTGFVIMTKDPAKQKAAGEFIDYYATKYGAATVKAAGQFPALQSVADQNIYKGDALMETMQKMLQEYPAGNFALADPNYGKLRVALSAAEQAIFSGLKTPEQAVSEFLAKAKQIEAGK
jgi:multiple sugar transport system substrate-binding protein